MSDGRKIDLTLRQIDRGWWGRAAAHQLEEDFKGFSKLQVVDSASIVWYYAGVLVKENRAKSDRLQQKWQTADDALNWGVDCSCLEGVEETVAKIALNMMVEVLKKGEDLQLLADIEVINKEYCNKEYWGLIGEMY